MDVGGDHDRCDATGKRRYATKAKAFLVSKWTTASNRKRNKGNRHQCHAYRCPFCDGFHVGHVSFEVPKQ